jgi:phage terminase large subunit-like protein
MADNRDEVAKLLAQMNEWAPAARSAALEQLRQRMEGHAQAFYCTLGRVCDGDPHEGYPYQHARGDQWPPLGTDWFTWFLSGGRGSGKTRAGAEYTLRMSHRVGRIALIAPTGADVRDTMIEGESGLQADAALAGEKLQWEPSKRRITFASGCLGTTFSAEKPARLRGPQFGFAWMDEPAHYDDPQAVWDMAMFGLRLGSRPHILMTSTPLPNAFTKARVAAADTRVIRVSTYANRKNLAESFAERLFREYEGTRMGRQELYGEVLNDVVGALWTESIIQHDFDITADQMDRIVIGIDPAGSKNRRSDETGIVAVGKRVDDYHVLGDKTGKYSPVEWAREAIRLYDHVNADCIVVEKNFGADMVKSTIDHELHEQRRDNVRVKVTTATRSKKTRAEPVVALYEQGHGIHSSRDLAKLETEMLEWVPGEGDSPNRIDAMVWAYTELGGLGGPARIGSARGRSINPLGHGLGPRFRDPLKGRTLA